MVEDGAPRVADELQRTAAQVGERALADFAPIGSELVFARGDRIREELQDILARHAASPPAAPAAVRAGRRRWRRGDHRKIIAQTFEHGLAQKTVVGDAAVFDFRLDDRLHPCRFRLLDRDRERRTPNDQRIEPLAHLARNCLGVAAARLSRVDEAISLAAADVERSDLARARPEFLHKGDDRKGVGLRAFELEPGLLAARGRQLLILAAAGRVCSIWKTRTSGGIFMVLHVRSCGTRA